MHWIQLLSYINSPLSRTRTQVSISPWKCLNYCIKDSGSYSFFFFFPARWDLNSFFTRSSQKGWKTHYCPVTLFTESPAWCMQFPWAKRIGNSGELFLVQHTQEKDEVISALKRYTHGIENILKKFWIFPWKNAEKFQFLLSWWGKSTQIFH